MAGPDTASMVVRHVSKSFAVGGSAPLRALRDVSMTVAKGAFVALLGPSGSGKSTLLRIIAGLDVPSDGEVILNGESIRGASTQVGLVFQRPTLLPWRTVEENVLLPSEVLKTERSAARENATALIELVGLAGFEDRYPAQLSGGMQQRAAIARSLAHDPPVLLLDEPFGALDALLREHMALELQRIWQRTGKSVVLVTHSIHEAVMLADRVIVFGPRPGHIKADISIHVPRPRRWDMIDQGLLSPYVVSAREALAGCDIK